MQARLSGQPASQALPAPQLASTVTQAEIVLWKSIENSSNTEDFRAYLNAYPNGAFSPLAQRRIRPAAPWKDSSTGLMWALRDNGSDITQTGALNYCRNLNLVGFQDWRLPEIDELAQIYDASVVSGKFSRSGSSYDLHLKGGIQMTECCAWSATPGKSSGGPGASLQQWAPVLLRRGRLLRQAGALCAPCRRMMGNSVI